MKNFYIKPLLIAIMIFTGCESFLEKEPLGKLTEGAFFETEEDAVLATNAIYNILRDWRFNVGFPVFDIMSDEATKGSNPTDATQILPFEDFTYTPTSASILNYYQVMYKGVRRANTVIEKVPEIPMDDDLKMRLIGEARLLRAHMYFNMVRAFGDLPKITSISPPVRVPRSPKEEIYQEIIINDLEFALEELPEKSEYPLSNLGRVTKGVARALLTKVYLFRKDFPNAERYALEVINSGEYFLDPDFANVFSLAGEHGSGSIFEIGSVSDEFALGGNQYANTQGTKGTPNHGWGFNRPSYDLITSFEIGDPRMEASVIFVGETLDGVTVLGDNGTPDVTYADPPANTIIAEVEAYNQKTWMPPLDPTDPTLIRPIDSWGHNRRVIRYADVLLMAAEALNENGNTAQALMYLNMVRARARGGDLTVLPDITETNKDQLLNIILEERKHELALEGQRFFDLVRTGKAGEILGPLGFTVGKNEVFPIPQNERDLSEGLITQNPMY